MKDQADNRIRINPWLVPGLAAASFLTLSCSQGELQKPVPTTNSEGSTPSNVFPPKLFILDPQSEKIMDLTNEHRAQNGLTPWLEKAELCDYTKSRLEFLLRNYEQARFNQSHPGLDEFVENLFKDPLIIYFRENLAFGFRGLGSEEQILARLKASPSHNNNLLSTDTQYSCVKVGGVNGNTLVIQHAFGLAIPVTLIPWSNGD